MTAKAYRGRYLIIAHILTTVCDTGSGGASRTLIMYKGFLSYAQLKEYISFLIEAGHIEEIPLLISSIIFPYIGMYIA
jgi:predicted transcriptional regulator